MEQEFCADMGNKMLQGQVSSIGRPPDELKGPLITAPGKRIPGPKELRKCRSEGKPQRKGVGRATDLPDAVQLTIYGLITVAARPAPVTVFAHFPIQGQAGPEVVKFHAWPLHDAPHGVASSPGAFTMPVRQEETLTLTVERRSPYAAS